MIYLLLESPTSLLSSSVIYELNIIATCRLSKFNDGVRTICRLSKFNDGVSAVCGLSKFKGNCQSKGDM